MAYLAVGLLFLLPSHLWNQRFSRAHLSKVDRDYIAVNRDKPEQWKADIDQSIALYNDRFIQLAPGAFLNTYIARIQEVKKAFALTENLTNLSAGTLATHPSLLPILGMTTCPPLSKAQLIRLSQVDPEIIRSLENHKSNPKGMNMLELWDETDKVIKIFWRMADRNLLVWLAENRLCGAELDQAVERAITIITDRWCRTAANDTIHRAMESDQLNSLTSWLENQGYPCYSFDQTIDPSTVPSGVCRFYADAPLKLKSSIQETAISIDVFIKPKNVFPWSSPLFINIKSSSDFANAKKGRKAGDKFSDLRKNFGQDARFVFFLCGYFDDEYLSYLTSQGIVWVWKHRIDDLIKFGV